MVVKVTRSERADDKPVDLEGLMSRWRKVNGAGDRFEIVRVKCEWIKIAVPAHDVVRVARHHIAREAITILREHGELALVLARREFGGTVKIALAVGRAHPDLAFRVEIAAGDGRALQRARFS